MNLRYLKYIFLLSFFHTFFSFSLCLAQENLIEKEYNKSVKKLFPLSPQQIEDFKKKLYETERSIKKKSKVKLITKTERISLKPGIETPVIKVIPGFVSSVAIFDVSGAPWPITSKSDCAEKWFSIKKLDIEPYNVITISSKTNYANSNFIITLKNLDIPISIGIKTEDTNKTTSSNITIFQVEKRGPMAASPTQLTKNTNKASIDPVMLSFVDMIPPENAKKLMVTPKIQNVAMWNFNNHHFLRTKYPVIWPAWTEVISSTEGCKVYKLPKVSSILISKEGSPSRLNIEELKSYE